MVRRTWAHERRHKTRNGWYLGMVASTSSILGLLIKTHDSESRGQEKAAYATTE